MADLVDFIEDYYWAPVLILPEEDQDQVADLLEEEILDLQHLLLLQCLVPMEE